MSAAPCTSDGSLLRFQDAFAAALLGDTLPGGAEAARVAALARQPAFAVYRNTVLRACVDALQSNYPAVARLVGTEWFRAAAALYARGRLPEHPALVHYGEGFAAFLDGFAPARELPYLADVARIDRLWTEAHTARDEACIAVESLGSTGVADHRRVGLTLHAATRWAWFDDHPAGTIWQRNRAPGPLDERPIAWRGEGALVTRPHAAVESLVVDAPFCVVLAACAAGSSIAHAESAVLAVSPAADVPALFAQLFDAGAFAGVTIDEAHTRGAC